MSQDSVEELPSEMTRGQVAHFLGLSPERIRQLTQAGKLRCRTTPLGRLYDTRSVLALAERRTRETPAPGAEER